MSEQSPNIIRNKSQIAESNYEKQLARLQSKHKLQIQSLKNQTNKQIQKQKDLCFKINSSFCDIQIEKHAMEEEYKKLQKQYADYKSKFQSQKQNHQDEMKQYNNKYQNSKDKVTELENQIDRLKQKYKQKDSQLKKQKQEYQLFKKVQMASILRNQKKLKQLDQQKQEYVKIKLNIKKVNRDSQLLTEKYNDMKELNQQKQNCRKLTQQLQHKIKEYDNAISRIAIKENVKKYKVPQLPIQPVSISHEEQWYYLIHIIKGGCLELESAITSDNNNLNSIRTNIKQTIKRFRDYLE